MPADLRAIDGGRSVAIDRRDVDLDAEAAVISAVLYDGVTALDQVRAMLPADRFYSDAHCRVWEAVCGLRDAGVGVDIGSVASALREAGRLAQVGGVAFLTELVANTPAMGPRFLIERARVVVAAWVRRQLAIHGGRMVSAAEQTAVPPDQIISDARTAIDGLAEALSSTERASEIGPALAGAIERIQAAATTGGRGERPCGFDAIDRLTAGLHPVLALVAGRPGMGKAQPLDARVLTPTGWSRMGDLREGDRVIGANGKPRTVTGVFDRGELDVYRVIMSDGHVTECCGDHLWVTRTRRERRRNLPGQVRDTNEIARTLYRNADMGRNHSIQYMRPAEFESAGSMPLDPYLLGVWLGDGCGTKRSFTISNPEPDIQESVARLVPAEDVAATGTDGITIRARSKVRTISRSGSSTAICELGLDGCRSETKFIPAQYLTASVEQRTRLLQGLCDTDGYVTEAGRSVEYVTVSERLREHIVFLVGSLGGYVTWTEKVPTYTYKGAKRTGQTAYRMILAFPVGDICPVSSKKHLAKWKHGVQRAPERYIAHVLAAGRKQCRCIKVSAPDQLYVTDGFIVTHNTSLACAMAVYRARCGEGAYIASLETNREEMTTRLLCAEARIGMKKAQTGMLTPHDWNQITKAAASLHKLPIWIDDTATITALEVWAKARQHAMKLARDGKKLGIVVVDYVQLLRAPRPRMSREEIVSESTRTLRAMAVELNVPVVGIAQLNRELEKRGGDKRPGLSDLRESGELEQCARTVMLVYRPDYYAKPDAQKTGLAEVHVAKQNNGPTGIAMLRFEGEFLRFDNLADGEEEYSRGD